MRSADTHLLEHALDDSRLCESRTQWSGRPTHRRTPVLPFDLLDDDGAFHLDRRVELADRLNDPRLGELAERSKRDVNASCPRTHDIDRQSALPLVPDGLEHAPQLNIDATCFGRQTAVSFGKDCTISLNTLDQLPGLGELAGCVRERLLGLGQRCLGRRTLGGQRRISVVQVALELAVTRPFEPHPLRLRARTLRGPLALLEKRLETHALATHLIELCPQRLDVDGLDRGSFLLETLAHQRECACALLESGQGRDHLIMLLRDRPPSLVASTLGIDEALVLIDRRDRPCQAHLELAKTPRTLCDRLRVHTRRIVDLPLEEYECRLGIGNVATARLNVTLRSRKLFGTALERSTSRREREYLPSGLERATCLRALDLRDQRSTLASKVSVLALELRQRLLRTPELLEGHLPLAPEQRDPRCVLQHGAQDVTGRPSEGIDLALGDDDVLAPTDVRPLEDLHHVLETRRTAVDSIARLSPTLDSPGQSDLRDTKSALVVWVVQGEFDLGPTERRTVRAALEDHLVHASESEHPGTLGAEHPGQSIDDVRLPGSIGPDDRVDPRSESHRDRIRERLETAHRERT